MIMVDHGGSSRRDRKRMLFEFHAPAADGAFAALDYNQAVSLFGGDVVFFS